MLLDLIRRELIAYDGISSKVSYFTTGITYFPEFLRVDIEYVS